jgi:hypothetical protein
MNWLWLGSYFFWNGIAANAIPHFVAGPTRHFHGSNRP